MVLRSGRFGVGEGSCLMLYYFEETMDVEVILHLIVFVA